jgi:3-mercaptopyruvate sulfurtransferase SseA
MRKMRALSRRSGVRADWQRGLVLAISCATLSLVSACQNAPTRVRETPSRKFDAAGVMLAPIRIGPETVLIDARSAFEYSVAHVPRSINIQWTDFTELEPESRGVLQIDLSNYSRLLAARGIGPSSQVVVMGRGLGGEGEEGRLAWTLAYLGITNVQFTSIDSFKPRYTNVVEENQAKSVPAWKLEPIESLNVTRAELLFAINNLGTTQPISFRSGDRPVIYRIIDVRTANAYLGREGFGAKHKIPNMDATNIPWKEFFDSALHPRIDIAKRLNDVGIKETNRIIVLDDDGLISANATMALRALGFSNAGNYGGGLKELMTSYGR